MDVVQNLPACVTKAEMMIQRGEIHDGPFTIGLRSTGVARLLLQGGSQIPAD